MKIMIINKLWALKYGCYLKNGVIFIPKLPDNHTNISRSE